MGFWRDLLNLFKSTEELKKEKNRERRRALGEAEKARDAIKTKIRELKSNRDKIWNEARVYLRDGQKMAAQRSLQSVQAAEITIGKLERKSWVFDQYMTKLEIAKSDQDFATALKGITAVLEIDPDQLGDIFNDVDELLGEQADVDKQWDKQYNKEMAGMDAVDSVPSVEEMMKNLEDIVIADVAGGTSSTVSANGQKDNLSEAIGAGRKNLDALLEGKDK